MLRQLLSASALILTTSGIASANIVRTGMHSAIASDIDGDLHQIIKLYTDRVGDVAIQVAENNNLPYDYWISCGRGNEADFITNRYRDGGGGKWRVVDRSLMEGHYADVACDRVN